jgi:hypothetical protein
MSEKSISESVLSLFGVTLITALFRVVFKSSIVNGGPISVSKLLLLLTVPSANPPVEIGGYKKRRNKRRSNKKKRKSKRKSLKKRRKTRRK